MNPALTSVEALDNYCLKLVFDNSEVKLFDVSPYLDQGIFKELKNTEYFKRVRLAFGAVEWPHEQDFSKDTLYLLSSAC